MASSRGTNPSTQLPSLSGNERKVFTAKSFHDLDILLKQWAANWAKVRSSELKWVAYSGAQLEQHLKSSAYEADKRRSKIFDNAHELAVEMLGEPEMTENLVADGEGVSVFEDICSNIPNLDQSPMEYTREFKTKYISEWKHSESTEKSSETLFLSDAVFQGISKVHASLKAALLASQAQEKLTSVAKETSLSFSVVLPSQSTNNIQVKRLEHPVVRTAKAKVAVKGAVVICCKKKVKLKPQSDAHYKWVVPVSQIVKDILQQQFDHSGFDLSSEKIIFLHEEIATNIQSTITEVKIIKTEPLSQHLIFAAASSSNPLVSSQAAASQKPNTITGVSLGATVRKADIQMALASQPNMIFSEGASVEDIHKLQHLIRAEGESTVAMLGNIGEVVTQEVAPGAKISNLTFNEEVIRGGALTPQPHKTIFASAQNVVVPNASSYASASSAAPAIYLEDEGQQPRFHEEEGSHQIVKLNPELENPHLQGLMSTLSHIREEGCFYPNFSLGNSNFKNMIEAGNTFIDKTRFIIQILDDIGSKEGNVKVFLRPTRFGKSLFINTLKCYLEKTKKSNQSLFYNLDVWKKGKKIHREIQGKCVVMHLSFKDVAEKSYEDALKLIRQKISALYEFYEKELTASSDKLDEKFNKKMMMNKEITEEDLIKALAKLAEQFHNMGKKVVILIDEYDTPINEGYVNGYQLYILNFFKRFFDSLLETKQRNFFFTVITGVINHFPKLIKLQTTEVEVHDTKMQPYSTCFGFTFSEMSRVYQDHFHRGMPREIDEWYSGYLFGSSKVFNPWAVINAVIESWQSKELVLKQYWANKSLGAIVRLMLEKIMSTDKKEKLITIILNLIAGNSVTDKDDTVSDVALKKVEGLNELFGSDSLFSYLTQVGYLTRNIAGEICLPNKEVFLFFVELYEKYTNKKIDQNIFKHNLSRLGRQLSDSSIIINYKEKHISSDYLTLLQNLLNTITLENPSKFLQELFEKNLEENIVSADPAFISLLNEEIKECLNDEQEEHGTVMVYFSYVILCVIEYDIIKYSYVFVGSANNKKINKYIEANSNLKDEIVAIVEDYLLESSVANLKAISNSNNLMISDSIKQRYAITLIREIAALVKTDGEVSNKFAQALTHKVTLLKEMISDLNSKPENSQSSRAPQGFFPDISKIVPQALESIVDEAYKMKNCVIQ